MRGYGKYKNFAALRNAFEAELRTHILGLSKPSESAKKYRIEHCLRVARIGAAVATAEGLDPELLELGCLLHDIAKWDAEKPVDHGRAGALIVRELAKNADLKNKDIKELTQGIAMHTDGLWNPRTDRQGTKKNAAGQAYILFDSAPSVLARSIGDCDNIDRFSSYRIGDTLKHVRFYEQTTAEQASWIRSYLKTLREQRTYTCATATAQKMWKANLSYQERFFKRLLDEL